MYVTPQGTFKILKNVPFNSDRKHTILFNSLNEQIEYMNSKVKYTVTGATYIRQEKVVRVPIASDNLFDCNYCMFKNTGFGNKWFFGFITGVEYVNTEVSALTIEIDDFQTWMFEINIGQCYVEREHVSDDTIGKNIQPENVHIGEYISNDIKDLIFTDWRTAIASVPNSSTTSSYYIEFIKAFINTKLHNLIERLHAIIDKDYEPDIIDDPEIDFSKYDGHYYGNIYSACDIVSFSHSVTAKEISAYLDSLISINYTIVAVYVIPDNVPSLVTAPTVGSSIDDYTPLNKKLLTYPYNFCQATSSNGDVVDFIYEDGFDSIFLVHDEILGNGCVTLTPQNYKNEPANHQYSLAINNFPNCTFSESNFTRYTASGGMINSMVGLAECYSNPRAGVEIIDVGKAVGIGANIAYERFAPQKVRSGRSSCEERINHNTCGFIFKRLSIKKENAMVIDSYFTRFGYAINRYKVPELNSRTSFNYVKTRECNITGNAPDIALKNITSMFNNGLTLWHTSDVQNYSLDNSIVGEE